MKKSIFLALLLCSTQVYAWTCPETNNSSDIQTHWNVATDVFWGRVVNGQYIEGKSNSTNVEFELEIFDTFKGTKEGTVPLKTSHEILFHGVEIGGNYIVFLYGNDVIDHCNILVDVGYQLENIHHLKRFYESQRDYKKAVIDYVLNQSTEKP